MDHNELTTATTATIFDTPTSPCTTYYRTWGKRAFDITVALALLPVIVPVIGVIALAIRSRDASALFGHTRIGQNGRKFRCLKIRTMVPDAERKLVAYLSAHPDAADEWERTQKLTNDPRITPVGRFLRKTSLDELPQIWNVIMGDMSFVGPRPVTEGELDKYGMYANTYLSMKPGITGEWQVKGRSDGCYVKRREMDVAYSKEISMLKDIKLMLRTVLVVVRPTGS